MPACMHVGAIGECAHPSSPLSPTGHPAAPAARPAPRRPDCTCRALESTVEASRRSAGRPAAPAPARGLERSAAPRGRHPSCSKLGRLP